MSLRRALLFFPLLAIPQGIFATGVEGVLNKLLAPGPLIEGHSNLEHTDCLKCHDAGKGVPDAQCLACHKEINPFVEQKRGFHGLTAQSCRECHADHKGRDFDSVQVVQNQFDHKKLTGYSLEGKHSKLKCAECHKEKRTKKAIRPREIRYFGSTTSCVSCHRKDDVHFFKGQWAKKDCATCHSPESWKEHTKFDHEKDAKYKLEGKHDELKCKECHIVKNTKNVSQYKWPKLAKEECLSCHQTVHKDKLAARFQNGKCVTCHSQVKWTIEHFDHKITHYPLRGKHAETKCVDCHKQAKSVAEQKSQKNWNWKGLNSKCLSCHEDTHKFGRHEMKRFAPLNQCVACHNESKWKEIQRFDHNVNTRYAIDGQHSDLKCAQCHLTKNAKAKPVVWINPGIYNWKTLTTKTCENCHKNPHIGQFSEKQLKRRCTECHVTSDWKTTPGGKTFDHAKTRFALTGAHKTTACAACHTRGGKSVYKFPGVAQGFCNDCHTNLHVDLFHKNYVQAACTACHTTSDFVKRADFDHTKTAMPLRGAHAQLECLKCHVPGGKKTLIVSPNANQKNYPKGKPFEHSKYLFGNLRSGACLTCHADVHNRQLGQDCMKCHTENNWKVTGFNHNTATKYPLLAKHADVACKDCHKPTGQAIKEFSKNVNVVKYAGISTTCSSCHKDPHKGTFGPQCNDCHTERGWKVTKDFHKNFTLSGIHFSLQCGECHKDGRKLAGLSQQCLACHQKDDVHYGTLPNCQDCHHQQFWDVTSFRHSLSQFPLRGTHRTLDCAQCHKQGIYQGLSGECISCHLQDAMSATAPMHSPIGTFTNCTDCHRNQFSFKGAH